MLIAASLPKAAWMLSNCCCMMLRPSASSVSGFGSERPRRLPMPAARMTICGLVACWLEDLLALFIVTVGLLDGMGSVRGFGHEFAGIPATFIYRLLIPRH